MRKSAFLTACVVGAVCAALALSPAWAGEANALGCIYVSDGGSVNNATTGYGIANPNIRAFDIPTSALITLQCMTGPCHVAVGAAATDAGRGLYLAALEKITSSTGSAGTVTRKADGGTYSKAVVSVAQSSSTAAQVCVWERLGNE